ncbi:MAG TPA: IPT/TIG domain-containing protein [Negativicutes bacterium]|nr:IPT/TIG domain-containing protein [Negativicutes bacterium]
MNTQHIRSKIAMAVSSAVLMGMVPLAAMAAQPSTTSLSPSFAAVGSGAISMAVNGSNFESTSVVYFNGAAKATTYVSPSVVTALIPASDLAASGNFNVVVVNPAAGGGTSNVQVFTVLGANPMPTVSTISPTSATAGGSSFTMTVNGGNFVPGSTVRFNGFARATAFVSGNQLTAFIPASDIAMTGTHAVYVENPGPGGGSSNALLFTINPVSVTPGLPNTGFGPMSQEPLWPKALAAAGIALATIFSAVIIGKQVWLVKR